LLYFSFLPQSIKKAAGLWRKFGTLLKNQLAQPIDFQLVTLIL
jgi:hypothetical protein